MSDAVSDKKGGKPLDGTPNGTMEAPPMQPGAAQPAVAVATVATRTFDRRSYQREYMRKYREAGRDKSRKGYKGGA